MRKWNMAAVAFIGSLLCSCSVATLLKDPSSGSRWVPIQELTDEFEGDRLDSTKWYDYNPTFNGTKPGFFSRDNVSISDGKLNLTTRAEDLPDLPEGHHTFTTAAVKSKTKVLYGYFEIKCKPMNSRASSSFWFYAQDPSPANTTWWTEIDVFETCGQCTGRSRVYHMNVHVFVTPEDGIKHWDKSRKWMLPFRLADDFHVYALLWDEKMIKWYVDGKLVRKIKNTHWHQPLHMNIDSQTNIFGLPNPEHLPSTFSIEYVRSWKKVDSVEQHDPSDR